MRDSGALAPRRSIAALAVLAPLLSACAVVSDYEFLEKQAPTDPFAVNELVVPESYARSVDVDPRTSAYCRGWKRAAYFGEDPNRNQPLGIFVQRVVPDDNGVCIIHGVFSKNFLSYPQRVYPFRAVLAGSEARVTTHNFHGFGERARITHVMRLDDNLLYYGAFFLDNSVPRTFINLRMLEVAPELFAGSGAS